MHSSRAILPVFNPFLMRLLLNLSIRQIRERYAGSALGIAWTLFQSLSFIALYWLVFSHILKVKVPSGPGEVPFIAFLLLGLLPWFAFQEGLSFGASALISQRGIIKKVLFPLELFPLSSALAAFAIHMVGLACFLVVYALYRGEGFSWSQGVLLLAALSLQLGFTAGLALLFSAVAVYVRDVLQILNIGLLAIFYTSGILYPLSMVSQGLRSILQLNPFTAFSEAYRGILLYGGVHGLELFPKLILLSGTSAILGGYVFRKLREGFGDIL